MDDERLTRSHTDRMLTGVAGGMAEHFDIDPVIVRLLWVLGALFSGGMLLVGYFVMAIIMPSPPDDEDEELDEEDADERDDTATDPPETGAQDTAAAADETKPTAEGGVSTAAVAASTPDPDAPGVEAPRERRRVQRRRARRKAAARRRGQGAFVIGCVLVVVGAIALADRFDLLSFWQFWPLILIGIGGALILGRFR